MSYIDVDFCLRLRERGYRNIVTPFAELIHRESASRGADDLPEHRERLRCERTYMRPRWGKALLRDRYFNPNFSLELGCRRISRARRGSLSVETPTRLSGGPSARTRCSVPWLENRRSKRVGHIDLLARPTETRRPDRSQSNSTSPSRR